MKYNIAVLLTCLVASSVIAADTPKPNIIFILADDLGIGNVSCYGADNYQTPHIDKLAAEGTRFTHAFTASLCGPSRALILSGRYAFRNGSTNQDACTEMPLSELRLARTLKTTGYVTSAIGKWGQLPGEPDEGGFDDYLRFNGSGVYLNTVPDKPERYSVNGKDMKLDDERYMSDLMQDHMMQFIRKNQEKPFFIYYSLSNVHGELLPTPDSKPHPADLMADNIAYMDKLVGKLVSDLEALKLRDNTLLIFMGDNGTGKGWAYKSTIGGRQLSGMKGSMLECGGLVPMIANWPGKTPAGKVCEDLVDSTDLLTTFAQLAGAKLPTDAALDGHSFAPALLGESGEPREWIFNQLARMWYVRDARWKLNQAGELFDMSNAPFTEKLVDETSNAEASPARRRLQTILDELNPAGGILDEGDGTGRHANKKPKFDGTAKDTVNANQVATNTARLGSNAASNSAGIPPKSNSSGEDRGPKFDSLDVRKEGKLSRDYYTTHQSDAKAAGERFDKFDIDNDGFITREEFVTPGD